MMIMKMFIRKVVLEFLSSTSKLVLARVSFYIHEFIK